MNIPARLINVVYDITDAGFLYHHSIDPYENFIFHISYCAFKGGILTCKKTGDRGMECI